jgi:hypothetical protein
MQIMQAKFSIIIPMMMGLYDFPQEVIYGIDRDQRAYGG